MALKRTTAAQAEPISLAQAKLHLRVDHDDEDSLIASLITTARLACEDRLERTLATTGWTLTLDSFPTAILLQRPPIANVASLQYIDPQGQTQTLSPVDYIVDAASEPGYIVPGVGKAWPATQDRVNALTVAYSAGYGNSVPQPLTQWMLLAIGDMYEYRARSTDKPAVPHQFADTLLDPYKIWSA